MKWLLLLGLLGAFGWFVASRMVHADEVPKVGEAAPDFNLPDQSGEMRSLQEFSGKWLVLYFYPKDDTPGCTKEACSFRDDMHLLMALNAQVVGISLDDTQSHAEFAKKHKLPFPLLADTSSEVAKRYGVLMNLVISQVAKRYTFLIDPQGIIKKVYTKVEPANHSTEVIEDLKRLTSKK